MLRALVAIIGGLTAAAGVTILVRLWGTWFCLFGADLLLGGLLIGASPFFERWRYRGRDGAIKP